VITFFSLLTQLSGQPIDDSVLPQIQKIKSLNQGEAETYIECLTAVQNHRFSKGVTQSALDTIAHSVLHPEDKTAIDNIIKDPVLLDEMNTAMGFFFAKLGWLRGPFMLGIYLSSAYLRQKRDGFKIRNYSPESTKDHAHSPVPVDGGGKITNGQDNINDKTSNILLAKGLQ